MDGFTYRRGRLHCEGLAVDRLAKRYGTPLYVYSRAAILARLAELKQAFRPARPLICYSVKANGNLSILRLLARAGAGFDIVSGGELFRVLRAGVDPARVVFAGVGKSEEEIRAAVRAGILMFNAESESELRVIDRVASGERRPARVALRLNPDVDARTHVKTTTGKRENKFGIDLDQAARIFARRSRYRHLDLCGVHLHLGSPIYSVEPYRRALRRTAQLVREARAQGAQLSTLNVGGGYCISYDGRRVIRPADYAAAILPAARAMGLRLILEPGRFIVGNAGILVSRVRYRKEGWRGRKFVILDAGMNDLLRPSLYEAYHHIWPVVGPASPLLGGARSRGLEKVDIVGPICETSDRFAVQRRVPRMREGDLVAIYGAGAYGMSMSSTYNSRPRCAEVMVSGSRARLIRKRETYEDLTRGE